MADKQSSRKKGKDFEDQVSQFFQKELGDRASVWARQPGDYRTDIVDGASNEWRVDIMIRDNFSEKEKFSPSGGSFTIPELRGIVECKNISLGTKGGGTLDTSLMRAYTELNDIHLKDERLKLYIVVSRLTRKGETQRDYRRLFETIGVRLVNFNDARDRSKLADELRTTFTG